MAKVQPLVLFNICDSFIRRSETSERVIGTLLGSYGEDGAVVIKNCYAVPHNENQGQVSVDIEFHKIMYDLHHRVNPKEMIVGWYSTGKGVGPSDALIQDFFSREVTNPIHLTVDTAMTDQTVDVEAYVSTSLHIGDKPVATQFHQIQVDLRMMEADRVGYQLLKSTHTEALPTDLECLQGSVSRLLEMLGTALEYVEEVMQGKRPENKTLGRYLMDTLATVPRLTTENFSKLFNDSVQDVLLVMYLANLTRSQLVLAEKLNVGAAAAI
eukprot:CAMPEP_0196574162 /NCGR_PEP_ID=MMETSP1081-20130531/3938_1 /TAXON_ID=36882 /ORGANISM="Pyramimonas amylifera, Strain CCMP720" /LENGTH=268 /DNA_ID=CAMNT_0041892107 /DNA_START=142 /DNA_END=948 /DNA_ORIENTATION=-